MSKQVEETIKLHINKRNNEKDINILNTNEHTEILNIIRK